MTRLPAPSRLLAPALVLGLGLGLLLAGAPSASADPDRDAQHDLQQDLRTPYGAGSGQRGTLTEPWRAGQRYTGTFADPSVLRVGSRFYAAATWTGGVALPVMSSTNLTDWTPRRPLPDQRRWTSQQGYNDAMPQKPAWPALVRQGDKRQFSLWAPDLARVDGRYLAAYSAAVRLDPRHSCIGIAVSRSVEGPYVDRSPRPLVCYRRSALGAIDPAIHVVGDKQYLLWKKEGVLGEHPPQLMVQRLDARGTGFAKGSVRRQLMTVDQRWEGPVVENPAMIAYRGETYLFYSGNDWFSQRYATGYARCAGPLGPCRKVRSSPLLASAGGLRGPGGADPFVDRAGRLRLAYAAWDAGRVGPRGTNTRRLHVATLGRGTGGGLHVRSRR